MYCIQKYFFCADCGKEYTKENSTGNDVRYFCSVECEGSFWNIISESYSDIKDNSNNN